MHALITRLIFDGPDAADEEMAELDRQATRIRATPGFRALYGVRAAANQVVIVRVFETAQGVGQSLAGPLRPDLAARFTEAPLRMSGEVVVAES